MAAKDPNRGFIQRFKKNTISTKETEYTVSLPLHTEIIKNLGNFLLN